ncbi:MAG: proprotein convertase P-domain-containing protein [Deltaproteobacteria bacterium]|nr:proprotein convertase P-domain-containing protein [Deltaproteobacteria bacterium]
MAPRLIAGCLVLLMLVGCRAADEPTADSATFESQQSPLWDGTPEAVGVLAFLNAPTTTFELLDDDVGLDKRAAENLVAFRLGADGVAGTSDDDRFETIEQVDGVKWVGPAAINRLIAYAEAQGFVPQGGDLLGVYDDVAFTVDEAAATLELVNVAPHLELDDDVELDRRAADAIVAARPILTMVQLEDLYYVGPTAMLALRDYPKGGGLANGEICTSHGDCLSGLCVGLTLGWDAWCADSTMATEFTMDEADEIPDGDPQGLSYDLTIAGLATVPVDVVLTIDIVHPNPADLVVVLHQPGGGMEVIWDHEPNPPSEVSAGWGIERDNMVNGTWTVEVIDTVNGNSGQLLGFTLWLTSNWD